MISKTMRTILHALSYGNIEVEASRRLADIKKLDAMRIFFKTLDTKVYNGNHEVPVRLYSLAISLQGTLTAGITGFGSTSIGDAAKVALADLENLESLTESTYPLRGFGRETSGLMVLFCLILMAYAVIKVFFSNLKRGGILLIQIAVGSLYMFSVPRGYGDGFIQWCKQVIGLCLTAFLQATILVAGLMVFKDHALLGLGLMLSAGEIPRIAGAFGLDTTTKANLTSAVYTAQSAVNIARTVAAK